MRLYSGRKIYRTQCAWRSTEIGIWSGIKGREKSTRVFDGDLGGGGAGGEAAKIATHLIITPLFFFFLITIRRDTLRGLREVSIHLLRISFHYFIRQQPEERDGGTLRRKMEPYYNGGGVVLGAVVHGGSNELVAYFHRTHLLTLMTELSHLWVGQSVPEPIRGEDEKLVARY
jgi:hypothetical protein